MEFQLQDCEKNYSMNLLKHTARIISFFTHPLFIGVYMAIYVVLINPYYFHYASPTSRLFNLLTVIINNLVFPILVVLLMKGLGFIDSITLKTQKERIVPYMASIIFFFWSWYVFYSNQDIPVVFKNMLQGIFFASIISMIANVFFKISMHAVGVGGMLGLMVIVMMDGRMDSLTPLVVTTLLTGVVISARMIASDHQKGDLLSGLFAGIVCQLIAAYLV